MIEMKGQMSLEMIIGLLILLVVAAVVIKLFLNSTQGLGMQQYTQALQYRNFKAKCESLCTDYLGGGNVAAAAQFCFTKLTGDSDLNRNGKIDAFAAETKLLFICEDSVYCFQVYNCKTDTGNIEWADCRQILCNAYYDTIKDSPSISNPWEVANTKVKNLFPNGIGSCTLPAGEQNWYNLYFGSNPCTQGPGSNQVQSSAPTTASVSCSAQSTTSIICSWSCPNAVSVQSTGSILINKVNQVVTITTQTGNYIFNNLTPGITYGIALTCDISQPSLYTGTSQVQL